MPRCDRRLRGIPKKSGQLWPPPDTAEKCRPAVHAASDRRLTKILRRLQTTPAKPEDCFKWLALEAEINGEIVRRNAIDRERIGLPTGTPENQFTALLRESKKSQRPN